MFDNLKKIFCFSIFVSIEIDLHNVINRDETSLYFDISSDITYDEIEVKIFYLKQQAMRNSGSP